MFFCGLDGGGTKTALCILDSNKNVVKEAVFGPMNINGASPDTVRTTIRNALVCISDTLPDGMADCAAITVGMAGISNQTSVWFLQKTFDDCNYHGKLLLYGDQDVALNGAINGAGAVLIAGTGSVCCGRDQYGHSFRTGGYGYLIDDVGSGYAIGRDILTAVVRANDGRYPETVLSKAVFEKLNANNIRDIITWLYAPSTGKREIAEIAPLLVSAFDADDTVAIRIADQAANDLSELVFALWRKANLTGGELAMTGGILNHYSFIASKVTDRIQKQLPAVCIHEPFHSPAYGAAMLALADHVTF